MELQNALASYDGSDPSGLQNARAEHCGSPGYLADLVAACSDRRPLVVEAATWMLKAEIDAGATLPRSEAAALSDRLDQLHTWASALHVLQALRGFDLDAVLAERYLRWAQTYASHPRPFLRAWSLDAQVVLGAKMPGREADVDAILRRSETDPAASVRARGRKLRQSLGF